ncbi:hypothetical protein BASA60_003408 [Batrachochytrium salamandrivorans]|nr:hypothetical protein BASA60_003408 [Batrachochytrium salamandrivorans]
MNTANLKMETTHLKVTLEPEAVLDLNLKLKSLKVETTHLRRRPSGLLQRLVGTSTIFCMRIGILVDTLAPRWSLKWCEADLDQFVGWTGNVEHESMGTRHDNRVHVDSPSGLTLYFLQLVCVYARSVSIPQSIDARQTYGPPWPPDLAL